MKKFLMVLIAGMIISGNADAQQGVRGGIGRSVEPSSENRLGRTVGTTPIGERVIPNRGQGRNVEPSGGLGNSVSGVGQGRNVDTGDGTGMGRRPDINGGQGRPVAPNSTNRFPGR